MGRFARSKEPRALEGPDLDRMDDRVVLRLPLGIRDGDLACWLSFLYRETDPLVVSVTLTAPSGAVAVERGVLRSDFRRGLRLGLTIGGLVMGPEDGGFVPLLIREGSATVAAVLPTRDIESFLAASDELVSPGWDSETDALNRALVAMLEGR